MPLWGQDPELEVSVLDRELYVNLKKIYPESLYRDRYRPFDDCILNVYNSIKYRYGMFSSSRVKIFKTVGQDPDSAVSKLVSKFVQEFFPQKLLVPMTFSVIPVSYYCTVPVLLWKN
jgi:hypothetical protein